MLTNGKTASAAGAPKGTDGKPATVDPVMEANLAMLQDFDPAHHAAQTAGPQTAGPMKPAASRSFDLNPRYRF